MPLDFANVCRLCLSRTGCMIPLFCNNDSFPNKIMTVVPILKMHEGDGFPTHVCQQCVHQVNNFYDFKLQCERSENTLHLHFKSLQTERLSQESLVSSDDDKPVPDISVPCTEDNLLEKIESNSGRKREPRRQVNGLETSIIEPNSQLQDIKQINVQDVNFILKEEPCDEDLFNIENSEAKVVNVLQIPFPCHICGKKFRRKGNLKEHIGKHFGGRPHACELCGKRFIELSSLKKHALSHTGQKAYMCDICGKRFTLPGHLKTHSLIHTGEKFHVCDVCGKSFSQLGNLKIHALLHTGEKPFSCSVCSRSFSRKDILQIHIATHTAQKPYTCDICGKSFAQSAHLKTHTIVHSGQKEFSCHICGTNFTRKHNLKKHAARHAGHQV